MPSPKRVYSEVLSNYAIIVLIAIILMGIMGILAIPYYVSPITYSNGGSPSGIPYLLLSIILIAMILVSIYLLERRNEEFGGVLLLFVLVILTILVWSLYGISYIKSII